MSSESNKIKPRTDVQLVLNYSNQCVGKNLKKDSRAGANVASRGDMALSATDPLSEIVWSPNKGFSLNCVDSSFADKNNSLYRDVGPSSMVFALLQSVTGGSSSADKPTEDVFAKPLTVICTKSDVSSTDTPTKHTTNESSVVIPDCKEHEQHEIGFVDDMDKMNTARGAPNLPNDQNENLVKYREKNICDQANIGTTVISEIREKKASAITGQDNQRQDGNILFQADEPKLSFEQNPSSRKQSNEDMDIGVGDQVVETEDGLHTMVEHIIDHKGSDAGVKNLTSSCRSPLEKQEKTVENYLLSSNWKATGAATCGVLVSKSNENNNKSQVNEMMLPSDENLPVLHSPSSSRIHVTRKKGKEKSSSNGKDSNISLSKEENDNHFSVFSAGKRRFNFQQEAANGSKRVKPKIQQSSYSKSFVKQDSSFMNLISNIMKGLSQSTQEDEGKSLALTLANPHSPAQKYNTCNKDQNPELKSSGFKSNSHSTTCPHLKNVRKRMFHQVGEASKDFLMGNIESNGINATPITCWAENWQSNKTDVSTRSHDSDSSPSSLQPKIRPINFFNSHENWRNNSSAENKNCPNLGLGEEKEGTSLHSSSTRQQNKNENVESYTLDERKETDISMLWITRFSPRSTDISMLPHSHKHICHMNNFKIEETREQSADQKLLIKAKKLQNGWINEEACSGVKDDMGNNDHTLKHKFNLITPFQGLRDSEPMVSMFARRLGAIKQCPQREKIVYHTGRHHRMVVHHLKSWG